MRRLAAFSLVLVMILSLGMGAALLIGRRQPPSERVERLHLTDCTPPCWDGIMPKVSSLSQVQQRIAATFPSFKYLSSINLPFQTWTVNDLAPNNTSIDVAVDDGSVYSINIGTDFVSEQMPNMGEVLAIYGVPACVSVDAQSGSTMFTYGSPSDQAMVQVLMAQPSLYSPILSMFVAGTKPFTCPDIQSVSWLEFRASRYSLVFTS
jgi:hypothetical protein